LVPIPISIEDSKNRYTGQVLNLQNNVGSLNRFIKNPYSKKHDKQNEKYLFSPTNAFTQLFAPERFN
jgi:hypothetical protein